MSSLLISAAPYNNDNDNNNNNSNKSAPRKQTYKNKAQNKFKKEMIEDTYTSDENDDDDDTNLADFKPSKKLVEPYLTL